MITSYDGKKLSAKRKAEEILADQIDETVDFWSEKWISNYNDMTDKEKESVNNQIEKVSKRIFRLLHY